MSGASGETQLLWGALSHAGDTLTVELSVAQFAREIDSGNLIERSISCGGVGKFKRLRCSHNHMRGNGAGQGDGRSHEDRLGRRHADVE